MGVLLLLQGALFRRFGGAAIPDDSILPVGSHLQMPRIRGGAGRPGNGQIELEVLRLYGLPEAAPALLCGTPALPVGQREFAAETTLDLPNLAARTVHLVDVTVAGARQGDRARGSLASSARFIELHAFTWFSNTMHVLARNFSASAFDLGAAALSVAVTKRRIP